MKIASASTVGIIGGSGKTGGQFAKLFRKHGFRVRVTAKATRSRNAALIRASDIIIFALPLSDAADLIRRELKVAVRSDQLILDVSSLKAREVVAMRTALGESIGMHPLFGPATDPNSERIILCPGRASKQTIRSLQSVLKRMGLRSSVMTPEMHDELMTTVQVIPHLKSLLMADVLRSRRTNLKKALATCTPTYEMEFNVIGRFLDDHPGLYVPIIFRNPGALGVLKTLRGIVDDYISIAESQDLERAEKRYKDCQTLFRPHLKRARAHSEACIRTLLSLTR